MATLKKNPPMTGAEFKACRESASLDRKALAELFDVHSVTLSKWENDKQAIPGPARLAVRLLAEREGAKREALAKLEAKKKEILDA